MNLSIKISEVVKKTKVPIVLSGMKPTDSKFFMGCNSERTWQGLRVVVQIYDNQFYLNTSIHNI